MKQSPPQQEELLVDRGFEKTRLRLRKDMKTWVWKRLVQRRTTTPRGTEEEHDKQQKEHDKQQKEEAQETILLPKIRIIHNTSCTDTSNKSSSSSSTHSRVDVLRGQRKQKDEAPMMLRITPCASTDSESSVGSDDEDDLTLQQSIVVLRDSNIPRSFEGMCLVELFVLVVQPWHGRDA